MNKQHKHKHAEIWWNVGCFVCKAAGAIVDYTYTLYVLAAALKMYLSLYVGESKEKRYAIRLLVNFL